MQELDNIMDSEELKECLQQIGEKHLVKGVKALLSVDFPEVIKLLRLKNVTEDDIADTYRITVARHYSLEELCRLLKNMGNNNWSDEENTLCTYALDVLSRFLALEIYFEHEKGKLQ
ncbi:MAG TPA: hypothetical protein ACFYD2_04165 [Candidatus Avalokitesvara rifleensis]|uniref:hypothetical protein n=1 Tax=Candidatus Avalokitesvara rifleensis TaxID=3367620 RepID=UPI0027128736|nr:hypothetical protein [Candidatus Brocadiales bacterium]